MEEKFHNISFSIILDKAVETKQKIYFSVKKLFPPQINVVGKVIGFWQQNLARFNIDIGGKEENLEFENSVIS